MAFDVTTLGPLPPLVPTPSIVVAATEDGNLGYNMTSNITKLMTGPTQLFTIQGGTHDYIEDTNNYNSPGLISRQEEHDIIVTDTLNFVRERAK